MKSKKKSQRRPTRRLKRLVRPLFLIQVTRSELLKMPMIVRRRALAGQTELLTYSKRIREVLEYAEKAFEFCEGYDQTKAMQQVTHLLNQWPNNRI